MRFSDVILHNLLRRKVRSLLTAASVSACVAGMITLVGFSTGFEQSSSEVYTARHVDLVVSRAGVTQRLTSNLDERLGDRLRQLPGVRAVNPSQTDIVSLGEGSLIGVPVQGWMPDGFAMQSLIVTHGRRLRASDHDGAVLGAQLATSLKKHLGDEVQIELQTFHVVGIFAGMNVYENMTAVVLLPDLQRLMDRIGQVTEFQLVLDPAVASDNAALHRLRATIEGLTNDQGHKESLAATPAREFVEHSSEAGMARAMAWGTSAIALLIGTMGMLNTMVMSVLERNQEIGILRALGWPSQRIVRMVVSEALVVSLVGSVVGVVGGLGLTWLLSQVRLLAGLLRPDVAPWVVGVGVLLAMAIGLVGGSYPAWRAAQLSPSEALHYE